MPLSPLTMPKAPNLLVELRRAEQAADTGYSHEIILHHAEDVNVLAKLGAELLTVSNRKIKVNKKPPKW